MPRGIKGSGKGREPAGEPRPLRRRGRKPKEAHPKVVQPSPDEGPALQPPDLPAQPPDLAAAETEVARPLRRPVLCLCPSRWATLSILRIGGGRRRPAGSRGPLSELEGAEKALVLRQAVLSSSSGGPNPTE